VVTDFDVSIDGDGNDDDGNDIDDVCKDDGEIDKGVEVGRGEVVVGDDDDDDDGDDPSQPTLIRTLTPPYSISVEEGGGDNEGDDGW